MLKILKESALILAIAAVLATASYMLRPDVLNSMPSDPVEQATSSDAPYQEISLAQARAMFASGRALFVDARPAVAYEAGHIQGAVNLDPVLFDQWAATLMDNHPLDKPIIAYCQGERCTLSHELAEKLTWLGYEEVYYLVDGWGRWTAAGLPAE